MGKYSKKIILIIVSIIVLIIGFSSVFLFDYLKTPLIDRTLEKDAYSYLPVEAKNFINTYYEETGTILLTEKNKKEGEAYLNPAYVEYLVLSDKEKSEIPSDQIPKTTARDYVSKNIVDGEGEIPSSYDLRDVDGNSYVSPVRDQGKIGICFAFVAAENVESHVMVKNNTPYVNSLQQINERQIDYGSSSNGIISFNNPYKNLINRVVGDAGSFDATTPLLASGASLIKYDDFKEYNDDDKSAMELSEVLRKDKSKYELMSSDSIAVDNIYRLSDGGLTETQIEKRTNYLNYIKKSIMQNGSLYLGIHMSTSCMHTDKLTGMPVMDVASKLNDNESCTTTLTDGHALELIGWDDNFQYSYCVYNYVSTYFHNATGCSDPHTGQGAWIVKNSKGDTNKPYLYVAYDSYLTKLYAVKEVKDSTTRDWDNSYYLGTSDVSIFLKNKTYNISNPNLIGEEKLVRLKLYSDIESLNYTIKIIDKDGVTHQYTKHVDNAGLFYYDIPDDIILNKSSTISISTVKASAFYDSLSIFTENINTTQMMDMSSLQDKKVENYNGPGTATRYYFVTKNIDDGTPITFKLYDTDGNDLTSKLEVGEKSNIVALNGVNALLTFKMADKKGNYIVKAYNGETLIGECTVIVNSMSGSGSATNPFLITNAIQFDEIRYGLHSYYQLNNDIDFGVYTSGNGYLNKESTVCTDGFGFPAIDGFAGSLDGNNHSLKNLRQNNYLTCNVGGEQKRDINYSGNGIFSNAYENVTISNLTIEDFDINCSGGACGLLISNYKDNKDSGEDAKYLTLNGVRAINGSVNGNADKDNSNVELQSVYGGGLLGKVDASHGYVNLGYIYTGYDLTSQKINKKGLVASTIIGKYTSIYDVQLTGILKGNKENGSGDGILNYRIDTQTLSINRILSTVRASKVKSNLIGEVNYTDSEIGYINTIGLEDKTLCDSSSDCSSVTNYNAIDIDNNFEQFVSDSSYLSWNSFTSNWKKEVVDTYNRLPFLLKFNFEYTDISDITIDQSLEETYNIKDYITPNSNLAKNVIAKSLDESIVKIDSSGKIDIVSSGTAEVVVKSLYDGLVKTINVSTTHKAHYSVILYPNGGEGVPIESFIEPSTNYLIPECSFVNNDYLCIAWNTESDGSGTYYIPGETIKNKSDGDVVKLYAQWRSLTDSEDIISRVYDIDYNNRIIDLIEHDTTLDGFLSKLIYSGYRLEVDTKNINGIEKVYTGGKTRVYLKGVLKSEYTNIVRGDVNGNGKIDIIDYIRIRKDIMGSEKLSGIFLKAADMDQNNTIGIIDYIRIRKIIMGGGNS